ncbi:DUF3047 domain-containing protein [uncultured Pseudacidovorax sp.]|uniref:DUF3047 domain-containing protein n=1 Tax=uncultured Pseudacidovorax sp. TaxID=679313 RepID=UPI0025F64FF6|nr:DUF3047 domain-containing protein [uncultured Pseudacidovorax sp.]
MHIATAFVSARRGALLLVGAGLVLAFAASPARADEANALTPFSAATGAVPPAPWHFSTLPNKTPTRFDVVSEAGRRVLKVDADDSYGLLSHRVQVPLTESTVLSWRWRVDQFVDGADLHTRAGDDGAAKLCVFFDFPADRLPLLERTRLGVARSVSGEEVPSEALCYVWDAKEAKGQMLVNAFTNRMHMVVLESGAAAQPGAWVSERRNLLADYRRAFGGEAKGATPGVAAVVVSADADNTHGHGLAYFSDLSLTGSAATRAEMRPASGGTAE